MFDVGQHDALSRVFMFCANMPKTLQCTAFLPLYKTWMFHVQQHEALSQVLMPSRAIYEHAQHPDIHSAFASLYNARRTEHIYSWFCLSHLDPKAEVADYLGK